MPADKNGVPRKWRGCGPTQDQLAERLESARARSPRGPEPGPSSVSVPDREWLPGVTLEPPPFSSSVPCQPPRRREGAGPVSNVSSVSGGGWNPGSHDRLCVGFLWAAEAILSSAPSSTRRIDIGCIMHCQPPVGRCSHNSDSGTASRRRRSRSPGRADRRRCRWSSRVDMLASALPAAR